MCTYSIGITRYKYAPFIHVQCLLYYTICNTLYTILYTYIGWSQVSSGDDVSVYRQNLPGHCSQYACVMSNGKYNIHTVYTYVYRVYIVYISMNILTLLPITS